MDKEIKSKNMKPTDDVLKKAEMNDDALEQVSGGCIPVPIFTDGDCPVCIKKNIRGTFSIYTNGWAYCSKCGYKEQIQ